MVRERKRSMCSSGMGLLSQQLNGLSEIPCLKHKLVGGYLASQPMRTWVSSYFDADISNIPSVYSHLPVCSVLSWSLRQDTVANWACPCFSNRMCKGEQTNQLQHLKILGALLSVLITLKLLQSFADAGIPSSSPRHRVRLTWVSKRQYHYHL